MKLYRTILLVGTAATLLGGAGAAQAAPIDWQDAQDSAGPGDVVSGGDVVLAWNLASDSVGDVVVDDVTFEIQDRPLLGASP